MQQTNYGDTSLVVKIYTELFGMKGYLLNGVRGPKAKVKQNIFQPLSLVEMVVYNKDRPGLQRISEIKPSPAYQQIPYNISKSTTAMFLNEVLFKAIKEEESNLDMFDYIANSLEYFDISETATANFHLFFLLHLTRHLGFFPLGEFNEGHSYFDLNAGWFTSGMPFNSPYLESTLAATLQQLLKSTIENFYLIKLTRAQRKELLDQLLVFYNLHLSGFHNIRSQAVLEEVMQ